VLIPSEDVFNERSGTVIAVPLTSGEPRAGFPLTMVPGVRAMLTSPARDKHRSDPDP
jgi:mRNA-degrading endonuclease toxin of MazEF toxin-antitoxin module